MATERVTNKESLNKDGLQKIGPYKKIPKYNNANINFPHEYDFE
jgi:hypothetical protein